MDMNRDKKRGIEISRARFTAELLQRKGPVLVAFLAPWSRPCQILDGVLDEVAATCAGSAEVLRVDADDNPELSMWYDVQSVPTLMYFANGELRARVVGTVSKEAIVSKLTEVSQNLDAPPGAAVRNRDLL